MGAVLPEKKIFTLLIMEFDNFMEIKDSMCSQISSLSCMTHSTLLETASLRSFKYYLPIYPKLLWPFIHRNYVSRINIVKEKCPIFLRKCLGWLAPIKHVHYFHPPFPGLVLPYVQ
jgi:hypothetical protein